MKKRLAWLVCLILALSMMTAPALAASSVSITLKADSTTVDPGDTVTITVTAKVDTCDRGGIEIDYDSSVFELVSGQWTISALLTDFDVGSRDGVFAYEEATPVSRSVFKFVLKVKSGAAPGASAVKVTFTADQTPAVKTISISVACDHAYDNSCDTTCNVCGAERTVQHSWDKGTVTQAATCSATGVKSYQCTVCGQTKTEKVDKTAHSYDNSCDTTCNACGATRSISHSWNSGKVTREATCTQAGEKLLTCKVCGQTKTQSIDKTAHSYDNKCDDSCNVCGYTRKTSHAYEWTADDTQHWQQCTVCGDKQEGQAHVLSTDLGSDETGHGYLCTECGLMVGVQAHMFDNACDPDCALCGYTREITHDYSTRWSSDKQGHWHECILCGDRLELVSHNPGPEATETTDQICLDCGFILQTAGNHVHTMAGDWLSDAQGHRFLCACGEYAGEQDHTWDAGTVQEELSTVTYTCTVCGYSRTEDYVPQTPADPGTDVSPPDQSGGTDDPGAGEQPQNGFQPPENLWLILAVLLALSLVGNVVLAVCLASEKKRGARLL